MRAVHSLREKAPGVHGLVVGARHEGLCRLGADLGVADRCRFAGSVPCGEVPGLVDAMTVGVALERPDRVCIPSCQGVRQYLAAAGCRLSRPAHDGAPR